MSNLQQFLLELGKGFAFVARQQKICTGDQDFFVDLVFYNFKLKYFLLVELLCGVPHNSSYVVKSVMCSSFLQSRLYSLY